MKEKDIVDFSEMNKDKDGDYIDKYGSTVGCEICYTHDKAYEFFKKDYKVDTIVPTPICPYCGKYLERRHNWTDEDGNSIVSEVNYSNPEGNIGFYSIWECKICKDKYNNDQIFALIPEPIVWNANHDIYYTGGKRYILDGQTHELVELIKNKIMPQIMNYIRRVLHPENIYDKNLKEDNLKWWCSGELEHAVAEWMYNHGWKK